MSFSFLFFKQKTAYEMRISDWSSDVCSSDLAKLRTSKCLATFARAHAKRMGEARRIHHQDLGPIMRKCNLRTAGENVAVGFRTGKAVVDGWMDSWGPSKNILSTN